MTRRVAIVDDDDITRLGTIAVLQIVVGLDVVGSFTHQEARRAGDLLATVDTLVVDAADRRCYDDQFPGVRTVEDQRRLTGARPCCVIAITGVIFDDAVRRRMREAGADYLFHRSDLIDAEDFARVVLDPASAVRPLPMSPDRSERLGVTAATRVNRGIRAAYDEGLISGNPDIGPRGRSRTARRERFNAQARLSPRNNAGGPIDRPQVAPSLPQIDRFLQWATKVQDRD